ncbi:MAG: hypothetical protein FWF05_08365 [Oscillospiraceae bacterium]|nr:hypothetical protein [Oscillospiraceae bacterium]
METSTGFRYNLPQKILITIMGAFFMGAMWRIRGDWGFGSFWGMLAVSLAYGLFLMSFFGYRKKMTWTVLPLFLVSMPLTIQGWMAVMNLGAGIINTSANGEITYADYNIVSGIFIVFCLGFGWFTFFSFLTGAFFSEKQYRARDFMFAATVYLVVRYAFVFFFSHLLMRLISPQVVEIYREGLVRGGVEMSPMATYVRYYLVNNWQYPYAGGRTYFNTAEAIGYAAATLGVALFARFYKKDKTAGRIMLIISTLSGLAFWVGYLPSILTSGGFHMRGIDTAKLPAWLVNGGWGVTEYSVGFVLGLFVTAYLVFMNHKKLDQSKDVTEGFWPSLEKKPWLNWGYHLLTTGCFALGASMIRPIAALLRDGGHTSSITTGIICMAIPAFIFFGIFFYRSIIKKKTGRPFDMSVQKFAMIGSPLVLVLYCAMYFFLGRGYWEIPNTYPTISATIISLWVVLLGYILLNNLRREK